MHAPIIAFESYLDGVGKTTTARAFARRVDGVMVGDIPVDPAWKKERQRVNNGDDVEARFDYFLRFNGLYMALARIVAVDRPAILDSTVYRTHASHRVLGSVAAWSPPNAHLLPDVTIQLELDEGARRTRISDRDNGMVYPSHWDETLYDRERDLRIIYGQFRLPRVDADTPPEVIVERSMALMPDGILEGLGEQV